MPDHVGEAIERLEAVLALGLQLDDGLLVQLVGQVEHRDDALGVDSAAAVVDVQLTRKGPGGSAQTHRLSLGKAVLDGDPDAVRDRLIGHGGTLIFRNRTAPVSVKSPAK